MIIGELRKYWIIVRLAEMGGAAMKEMMHQIELKKQNNEWIEYDMENPANFPLPIDWSQTEKGLQSKVSIGHPRISNSVQPKQKKRWTPMTPAKCVSASSIQIGEIPICLEWKSLSEEMNVRREEEREDDEKEQEKEEAKWAISPAKDKDQQKFEYGTCVEDIYHHSWLNTAGCWLRVPKGVELNPDLGFPARASEVRRFAHLAKRLVRITPRFVDSRSFVDAVVGGRMDRRGGQDYGREEDRSGKYGYGEGNREGGRSRSGSMLRRDPQNQRDLRVPEEHRRFRGDEQREAYAKNISGEERMPDVTPRKS